jgi:hypothetical protein
MEPLLEILLAVLLVVIELAVAALIVAPKEVSRWLRRRLGRAHRSRTA